MNELTSLAALHLRRTAVTDNGLARLKELSGLKLLDIRDTWVSAAGVEEFEHQHPSMLVHY